MLHSQQWPTHTIKPIHKPSPPHRSHMVCVVICGVDTETSHSSTEQKLDLKALLVYASKSKPKKKLQGNIVRVIRNLQSSIESIFVSGTFVYKKGTELS